MSVKVVKNTYLYYEKGKVKESQHGNISKLSEERIPIEYIAKHRQGKCVFVYLDFIFFSNCVVFACVEYFKANRVGKFSWTKLLSLLFFWSNKFSNSSFLHFLHAHWEMICIFINNIRDVTKGSSLSSPLDALVYAELLAI